MLFFNAPSPPTPGCIPCKTHAGGTPVAPQVYSIVGGWRTPEMQTPKEPCFKMWIFYAVRQRLWFRIYPRRHATMKANCTPEISGPKCMECTLAPTEQCCVQMIIFPPNIPPAHQQHCFVGGRGGKSMQSQNFCEGFSEN